MVTWERILRKETNEFAGLIVEIEERNEVKLRYWRLRKDIGLRSRGRRLKHGSGQI